MKSYFTVNRMCFQGKAWQIRILLSQWKKEAGASTTVADLLHRCACR